MTNRELIRTARLVLPPHLYDVWILKHGAELGRRRGSMWLGITEDAYRYRLLQAEQRIVDHLEQQETAWTSPTESSNSDSEKPLAAHYDEAAGHDGH